jgi:stage V sporulation protein SpoVS
LSSAALGLVTDVDNDASGEQEKKVVKKASLTAQQFNKAVKAIARGYLHKGGTYREVRVNK